MRKIICQIFLIGAFLLGSVSTVFAACVSNSDCLGLDNLTCGGNGLTYGSKCENGTCVPDVSNRWCESSCCNTECQDNYGKSGSCASNSCVCSSCVAGGGSCSSVGCCSGYQCCSDKICKATCSTPSGGLSNCQAGQICNPLKYSNFEGLINAIIGFLIKIGAPIAALMFVIAGIIYVTSVGDPGRVKTARSIMIYTAVGFAVIILASGLIKVVQSLLGG